MSESPVPGSGGRGHLLAVLLGVAVALLGGVASGALMAGVGHLGVLSLWGIGLLAGYGARSLQVAGSKPVAWSLVAGCGLAMLISEAWWIHHRTVQGSSGLLDSFLLLPTFMREYPVLAMLAALCAALGAREAHQLVLGRRSGAGSGTGPGEGAAA